MQAIGGLITIIILGAIYFLPYIVARRRKHRNAEPIGLVTLFFGWTVIGWAIALIWSMTANVKTEPV